MKQPEITSKQQQQSQLSNQQSIDDRGKAVVNTSEANFIQKIIKETQKDFIYEQSLVDCALIFSKLRAFQQVYQAKGLASIAQFLKKCSIIEISQANKVFYERERRSEECSAFLLLRGAIKIEEFAPQDKQQITTQPGNDQNKQTNNAQQVLIKKSIVLRQNTAYSKNESSKEKDQIVQQQSNENKESNISAEQNVFTINEMELFGQRKREGRPTLQRCIALSEQCILLSFELSSLESLFAIDEAAVATVREKKNILNDLPLFSQCSFKQITSLSQMATTFTLLKGEKLYSQDDPSKGFFYLLKGELEVVLDSGTSSQMKTTELTLNDSELLRKNSGKSRLLSQYSEQHCNQVGILTAYDVVGLEDLVLERPRSVRIQVLSYEATVLYFPLQSYEIQTILNEQTKSNIASTAASQVAWRQTRAKINSTTLTKCQFYNSFVQSPKIQKKNDNSSIEGLNSSSGSRRKTEQSFFETPSKDNKYQRHSPICSSKEHYQNSSDRESFPQQSPLNKTYYKQSFTPNGLRQRNHSGEGIKFERLKDANRNFISSSASNKKEYNNLQEAIRKEQPGSLKDKRNGWFNMNDSIAYQKVSSFVELPAESSLQQIPLLNESQDILNMSSNNRKWQFMEFKNSASLISDFASKTSGSQRKKITKPNKITLPVFRLEKILKERENNGQVIKSLDINDGRILTNKHSFSINPNKNQEDRNNNNSIYGELSHQYTFSGEEDGLNLKSNNSMIIEKDSVSVSSGIMQKSGFQPLKDNSEDTRSLFDNIKNDKEFNKGDKQVLRNVTQLNEGENRIIEADETIRQKLEIKKQVLERFAEIPKGENDNQERYIYPRHLFDRKKEQNIRIQLEKCRLEEQQRSTSLYLHNTRYEHSGQASFILFEDYKNRKMKYFKRDKNLLGIADTKQGTSQANGSALIPPLIVERSAAVKNNKRKLKNSRNTEYGNFLNKQTLPRQNNQSPFRWQE